MKILLRLAALLLPLQLVFAFPAQAEVTAQVSNETEQMPVIALLAVGNETDMQKLEKAAEKWGYPTGRSKNNADEDEVMLIISKDVDPASFWPIRDDIAGGKYGDFKLSIVVVPMSEVQAGKEVLDAARVYPTKMVDRP